MKSTNLLNFSLPPRREIISKQWIILKMKSNLKILFKDFLEIVLLIAISGILNDFKILLDFDSDNIKLPSYNVNKAKLYKDYKKCDTGKKDWKSVNIKHIYFLELWKYHGSKKYALLLSSMRLHEKLNTYFRFYICDFIQLCNFIPLFI